ncbi:organic cation/carnitine transporter 2-like isoform X2 [Physella acuta]|uniref:organic cation/carnitine transporter 2-like isoform X2 n=1 Tax=Physella acuta TaxID=109671 RepID=UPI0027DBD3C0|nr:organic cation/carnitine transporter 2-like isoform X2 [Physella acuta]
MTLENVFQDIGGFSLFQIIMIAFVYGIKSLCAWSMLMVSFAGVIPPYYCTTTNDNTTTRAANQSGHDVMNVCDVNGTSCTDFLFQSSPRTIISEWSLVCSLKWVKSLIVSIQMAGVLVGAAVAGQTGDTYGRKNTIYGFFLLQMALSLTSAFSVTWEMFCALRFFIGVSIGAVLVTSVPFCGEFFPPKWRVMVVFPVWAIGGGTFALAAWILKDWEHLHIATAAVSVPSMLGYFYFPESVRWLAVKGRLDEAHVALEKMARMNRKTVPGYAKDVLQKIYNDEIVSKSKGSNYSYIDVFRTWKLAKTTCILSFQWFGRGNCCRVFLAIACLASMGCLVARTWAPVHQAPLIMTGLSLVAKLGVSGCWGTSQVWIGEIYPTVIRSLGYGVMNTFARVGGILSPYAVNLDDRPVLSYIIMGSMSGLSLLLLMFVEETKDRPLQESLYQVDVKTDAQSTGTNKKSPDQIPVNEYDKTDLQVENKTGTQNIEVLTATILNNQHGNFCQEKSRSVYQNGRSVSFLENTEKNNNNDAEYDDIVLSQETVMRNDESDEARGNEEQNTCRLNQAEVNEEIFIISTKM